MSKPLLMIPGPIEISDEVFAATQIRPASHVAPDFKRSFHLALHAMRTIWGANDSYTPFVVSGGGTLAMESAATNLVQRGEPVLVVNTGYFGDRMAEMLHRRGAEVFQVGAQIGERVNLEEVRLALQDHKPVALFATHVDTSTGVCEDVKALAALATEAGCLSVFDGVCATAAEDFFQVDYGADVYFTASQKAIGLPPGLALWVCSPAAMDRRRALTELPPHDSRLGAVGTDHGGLPQGAERLLLNPSDHLNSRAPDLPRSARKREHAYSLRSAQAYPSRNAEGVSSSRTEARGSTPRPHPLRGLLA